LEIKVLNIINARCNHEVCTNLYLSVWAVVGLYLNYCKTCGVLTDKKCRVLTDKTCRVLTDKTFFGFSQHSNILFYFYLDDYVLRSRDLPQVIFTSLLQHVAIKVKMK